MPAKQNYQQQLETIIKEISLSEKKPTLLLHACCGPCSSYVMEYLAGIFNITIYYYNPNIHPKEEYDRRLAELKKFLSSKIHIIQKIFLKQQMFGRKSIYRQKAKKVNVAADATCSECSVRGITPHNIILIFLQLHFLSALTKMKRK